MSTVSDIPVRDGQDGTTQLSLLRLYLKDSVNSPYKFPDVLLIPLLVSKDRVSVWRDLTGYGVTAIPWSYDVSKIALPLNRIRVLIEDTIEDSMKYTDFELLRLLNILPLRYVVTLILAKTANTSTLPTDPDDPIHILRKYLQDEDLIKYTDSELVDLIVKSGLDPFGVVMAIVDKTLSMNSSEKVLTTGTNLASLDGISFSTPSEELKLAAEHRASIQEHLISSAYFKDPIYATYVAGVRSPESDWEVEWNAIS